MKDMIIMIKARGKKKLSWDITNITTPAEVAWASSWVDFANRYKWAISDANLDKANELRLTSIKKY